MGHFWRSKALHLQISCPLWCINDHSSTRSMMGHSRSGVIVAVKGVTTFFNATADGRPTQVGDAPWRAVIPFRIQSFRSCMLLGTRPGQRGKRAVEITVFPVNLLPTRCGSSVLPQISRATTTTGSGNQRNLQRRWMDRVEVDCTTCGSSLWPLPRMQPPYTASIQNRSYVSRCASARTILRRSTPRRVRSRA